MNRDANNTNMYTIYNDPVVDRTFLPKKALDLCKNIPLNWVVKHCESQKESGIYGIEDV